MNRIAPRRLVALALLVALAASSAACGARWSDDQHAEVVTRDKGGSSSESAASDDDTTELIGDEVVTDGGTTGGGSTSTGSGGTTTGGTGATGAAGPSGPRPCAAKSSAPGVTDSQITVGSISSLSGPVPGLGASGEAAVRAYVAYRNASGGVCGRQIVLRALDDGTDNGRYRGLVNELAPKVLGLVGGFAAGDPGGAEVIEQLKLPMVATVQSDNLQNVSTVFDTNPPFADLNAVTAKYKFLYDQGVRTAAIAFIGVDQSRAEALGKQRPLMEAAGIKIVSVQDVPISTLSYDSAARTVANSKADYLYFLHDAGTSATMARAMADTGYTPKFSEYLTAYGSNFIQLAGPAAEGATSWIRFLPTEDGARSNKELATYLEWMERSAPGAAVDTIAADSWAAPKAFFDNLEALPGPITREAFIAQLRTVDNFDAGGFFGPIRLAPKKTKGCYVAMRVQGGKWTRLTPAQGFLC